MPGTRGEISRQRKLPKLNVRRSWTRTPLLDEASMPGLHWVFPASRRCVHAYGREPAPLVLGASFSFEEENPSPGLKVAVRVARWAWYWGTVHRRV